MWAPPSQPFHYWPDLTLESLLRLEGVLLVCINAYACAVCACSCTCTCVPHPCPSHSSACRRPATRHRPMSRIRRKFRPTTLSTSGARRARAAATSIITCGEHRVLFRRSFLRSRRLGFSALSECAVGADRCVLRTAVLNRSWCMV